VQNSKGFGSRFVGLQFCPFFGRVFLRVPLDVCYGQQLRLYVVCWGARVCAQNCQ